MDEYDVDVGALAVGTSFSYVDEDMVVQHGFVNDHMTDIFGRTRATHIVLIDGTTTWVGPEFSVVAETAHSYS